MITRRCVQRMFLLRPDPTTNAVVLYCLIEAAQRYGIGLILASVLSNHHHTAAYDPYGNIIEFIEHFHKLVAKALNAHWGRWENLWSTEEPSLVEITSEHDLLEKCVYIATNPVKDGLVAKVSDWPGVSTLDDLLAGRTLTVERPKHFFRENGPMPAEVQAVFRLPAEVVSDPAAFLKELAERVSAKERACAEERANTGRQVLGRNRVLRQSWRDSPTSFEPRRQPRPRVAARNIWQRIAALQRNKEFQLAYRAARKAWLSGLPAIFPAGTYALRKFANVIVEAASAVVGPATPSVAILN